MVKKLLFLFTLLLSLPFAAVAQYKIEEKVADAPISNLDNKGGVDDKKMNFASVAAGDEAMRKKQLKKERNYFETKNSIVFTQFANKNWVDGGDNTFNGRITSYVKHVYKKDRFDVTTFWDASYGGGWQDSVYSKTEDKFRLNTALNYAINKHFYYNLNFDVSSQFTNGYAEKTDVDPSSSFFAPGVVSLGLGMNYKLDDKRYIILSPITGSLTAVLDEKIRAQDIYSLDPGKSTKTEFGMSLNIEWTEPIFKDKKSGETVVQYRTSTQSFWKYYGAPTLNWQNWIDVNVYKYFTVNLSWTVIYDDSITTPSGSYWQFNQSLALGVSYTFKNKSL